jgi:hypothetical protein
MLTDGGPEPLLELARIRRLPAFVSVGEHDVIFRKNRVDIFLKAGALIECGKFRLVQPVERGRRAALRFLEQDMISVVRDRLERQVDMRVAGDDHADA